jgi:hypothetical protein
MDEQCENAVGIEEEAEGVASSLLDLPDDLVLAILLRCDCQCVAVRATCKTVRDLATGMQECPLDECQDVLLSMQLFHVTVSGSSPHVHFQDEQFGEAVVASMLALALRVTALGQTFRAYEQAHQVLLRAAAALLCFYQHWFTGDYFNATVRPSYQSNKELWRAYDETLDAALVHHVTDPNMDGLEWECRRRVLEQFSKNAYSHWHVLRSTAKRAMERLEHVLGWDHTCQLTLCWLKKAHTGVSSPFCVPWVAGPWQHFVAEAARRVEARQYAAATLASRRAKDRQLVRDHWLRSVDESQRRQALALAQQARDIPRRSDRRRRAAILSASRHVQAKATLWWNGLLAGDQLRLMLSTVGSPA